MASPSKAQSSTFAYASSASENHLSSNQYFSTIVVDNGTSVTLAVATDGGTAGSGASTHEMAAPPNSVSVFPNLQPLPNADVPGQSETAATDWTAQAGWVGTGMTFASIVPQATATGSVSVSFQ